MQGHTGYWHTLATGKSALACRSALTNCLTLPFSAINMTAAISSPGSWLRSTAGQPMADTCSRHSSRGSLHNRHRAPLCVPHLGCRAAQLWGASQSLSAAGSWSLGWPGCCRAQPRGRPSGAPPAHPGTLPAGARQGSGGWGTCVAVTTSDGTGGTRRSLFPGNMLGRHAGSAWWSGLQPPSPACVHAGMLSQLACRVKMPGRLTGSPAYQRRSRQRPTLHRTAAGLVRSAAGHQTAS